MRLLLISILFILFCTQSVYACSCVDGTDSIEKFLENKTVFTGFAADTRPAPEIHPLYGERMMTTFASPTILKGEKTQTISVQHSTYGASCGLMFELGIEHFIVSYNYKIDGPLQTDICTLGVADRSSIEDYLQTGTDRKVIGREICFLQIKQAYDNDIHQFRVEDEQCEAYIEDYNQRFRPPKSD